MKGLLRALLFGVTWSLALIAIANLFLPDFLPTSKNQALVTGAFAALGSAVALWVATRSPATPSWLTAIVGWIVGFSIFAFVL
jgi:hypothetical protein